MSNPYQVYDDPVTTTESEAQTTGLPVETGEPPRRQITIKFGEDGSLSYVIGEGLNKHEIIGAIEVVKEQIKREMIIDPVFMGLRDYLVESFRQIHGAKEEPKKSELLEGLKDMVSKLEGMK